MARLPDPATPALDVVVVAHTHWDREWYHAAPRFRQRLAALVDALLAGAPDGSRPFLLDGQAVVLEDVASLRPDLRALLDAAIRAGAIEAGPWYVLADELLPGGEALVRNLLAGRRVLRAIGAAPPPVCYSPDAFGHPAALPALAAGFGLAVGVLWRGYGGPRWPDGDTLRWRAPDGSTLLAWHLPPDGYEYGSALPSAAPVARARWRRLREAVASRARTGVILCTNGADHHAAQPDLDAAVDALATAAAETGDRVLRGSLAEWARRFSAAAAARDDIPEVRGELRDSTGYTWSLQGTFGTRAPQKRRVARADRELRYDVEPWVALAAWDARRRGVPVTPDGRLAPAALPALLRRTWATFLRTLPHDTLCGCSIDAVAQALEHRLAVVHDEARGLREAALESLLGRDAVTARARSRDDWRPQLVLRNRLAWARHGLVELTLGRTVRDVPVGPGSAGPRAPESPAAPPWPVGLVAQTLGSRRVDRRRESPQHYPDNDLVEETRVLVWLPEALVVPGFGLRVLDPAAPLPAVAAPAVTAPAVTASAVAARPAREADAPAPVRVERHGRALALENGRLRLEVQPDGITLVDQRHGRRLPQCLRFTWQADHGDSYTPAPRGRVRFLRPERGRLLAAGPLRAAVRVTWALEVPRTTAPDERADEERPASRRGRPPRRPTSRLVVHATCTLDAGAAHLGIRVHGIDRAGDHRLRLVVTTGLASARIVADAACWPVSREPGTHPLHRWVALDAGAAGVALVADGLAECEARPSGQLAVTLVRATGELSRRELPERPGHAGWPARIPGAQGPGRFVANFALAPLGAFSAGEVSRLADECLLPLVGDTWRDAPADPPRVIDGPEFAAPSTVQPLAVLPADDGDGVVLRCVNLEPLTARATWRVPWRDASAQLVRLDESPLESSDERVRLAVSREPDATRLALTLAPYAIASVRVR
jgi:mannosylglycerate hydrolase